MLWAAYKVKINIVLVRVISSQIPERVFDAFRE